MNKNDFSDIETQSNETHQSIPNEKMSYTFGHAKISRAPFEYFRNPSKVLTYRLVGRPIDLDVPSAASEDDVDYIWIRFPTVIEFSY